jgi:hypothetical protein
MTTDQDTYTHQQSRTKVRRWRWIGGIVSRSSSASVSVPWAQETQLNQPPRPAAQPKSASFSIRWLSWKLSEMRLSMHSLRLAQRRSQPREPESEPIDGPAEIGDSIVVEWGSGDTGHITITDVESTTKPYDKYGSGPKHDRFVIFDVDLEARADQFDVYEDDFYVVIDGTRYDHGEGNAYDAADYDDQLGYAELNAGEKKSGLLVFDLPEGSGELFYAPNFEGGAIASWKF